MISMNKLRSFLACIAIVFLPVMASAQFTVKVPGAQVTSSAREDVMPPAHIFIDTTTIPVRKRVNKSEMFSIACVGTYAVCQPQANQQLTPNIDSTRTFNSGAFREGCAISHFAFDDPIVYPGQAGRTHLHQFAGNDSTSALSVLSDMSLVGNSTCGGGTLNRTGYWWPPLIGHCPAGSTDGCLAAFAAYGIKDGHVFAAAGGNFYYKCDWGMSCDTGSDSSVHTTNPTKCPTVQAQPAGTTPGCPLQWPPVGFRFIQGSAINTVNWTVNSYQAPYKWTCVSGSSLEVFHIPTAGELTAWGGTCSDFSMSINFQRCWDGVNIDGPAGGHHNEHVDSTQADFYEGCRGRPAFPVMLPEIALQVHYNNIPNSIIPYLRVASDMSKAKAVADNGATFSCATAANNWCAGVTAHADWVNGWSHTPKAEWGGLTVTDAIKKNCYSMGDSPFTHTDCHDNLLGDINNNGNFWRLDSGL